MKHTYLADSLFSLIRNIFLVIFFFHKCIILLFLTESGGTAPFSLNPALDEGE